MLGIIEFLTQDRNQSVAKTINVVTLLYIEYNDFINCIQQFKNDYEQFCMIRDKVSVYNNYNGLDYKCYVCNKYNHIIKDCPFLNFQPNHQKLIYLENSSQNQERNEKYERGKFKINVFQQLQNIQAHSRRIQSMNIIKEYYEEQDINDDCKDIQENDKKSSYQLNNVFGTLVSQKNSTYKHVDWELPSEYSPTQTAQRLTQIQLARENSKNRSYIHKEQDQYKRDNSRKTTQRFSVFNPQQQQQQQQQQMIINTILQSQGCFPNNSPYFFPNPSTSISNNGIIQLQPIPNNLNAYNIYAGKSSSNLNLNLDIDAEGKNIKSQIETNQGDNVGSTSGTGTYNQLQGPPININTNTNNNNSFNSLQSPFHQRSLSRDLQNQNQTFSNVVSGLQQQIVGTPSTAAFQQMQRQQLNLNSNYLNNQMINSSNNIIYEMDSSRAIQVNERNDQVKALTYTKNTYSNYDTLFGYQYQQLSDYITLDDLDVNKNFKVYFPHNNISKILKEFNVTIKTKSTFKTNRIRRFKKKKPA